MKNLLLTLTLLFTVSNAFCQADFNLPENIELKNESDYAKYNNDVINAAKWLEQTALNKEEEKRKKVDAFIVQWVSGTPDISVDINQTLGQLYGENNELLVVYLASYSRYFLENKKAKKTDAIKAGIMSMMNVYRRGIAVVKNNEMENAIKAYNQNKLDKYIADNFK